MYGGFWKSITSVHQHMDIPLGLSDMFFQRLNTHRYSPVVTGTMSAECFWRRRARTDQRWDKGVGSNGGQRGSNARARRSLAVAIHVSFKSPPGARPEATHDGGGSQPEERHGQAAAVLTITRRRRNPVRGVFGDIYPYPPSFEERRLDPCASRYPVIDRLPRAVCLGLS
jgi:hypothetical protein